MGDLKYDQIKVDGVSLIIKRQLWWLKNMMLVRHVEKIERTSPGNRNAKNFLFTYLSLSADRKLTADAPHGIASFFHGGEKQTATTNWYTYFLQAGVFFRHGFSPT